MLVICVLFMLPPWGPQASVTVYGEWRWPQQVESPDGGFRLGLGACL